MKKHLHRIYKMALSPRNKRGVITFLKRMMPRFAFAVTRHPDFAFYHARHLVTTGQIEKAAALYGKPLDGHADSRGRLKPYGATDAVAVMHDPLFVCKITGVPEINFRNEFSYLGLKIQSDFPRSSLGNNIQAPEYLEILLDGQILRKERLVFNKSTANFSFTVRRETLDLFPPTSKLGFRLSGDHFLGLDDSKNHVDLCIPHGNGAIFERLAAAGPLDKKGFLRLTTDELRQKQDEYLNLYMRACTIFEEELGRPLFLLYGTLLGQHRNGDFIPGDDDFDVGYVSAHTDPAAVKTESIDIMERLVELGFTVVLNRSGKPHRLRDDISGAEIHLDNRPVFTCDDGHVWMHKLARLDMSLDDFSHVEKAQLRGVTVYKPRGTERFLSAYYGSGWRVPDPGFSNTSKAINPKIEQKLSTICLSKAEQAKLLARIETRNLPGKFIPIALQDLYPVDEYYKNAGQ